MTRNDLPPLQQPWSFGLAFWAWFALAYAAVFAGALAVAALLGRVSRAAWLPRAMPALMALGFLSSALIQNSRALRGLMTLSGPWRFRVLAPLALGLLSVGLVTIAFDRRRTQRMVGALAMLLTATALWPPRPSNGASASKPLRVSGERVLLIGVDGGDWRYLDALMAQGELPRLAALKARGAWGPLQTFRPTLSPAVWTTIATGRRLEDHGIRDFNYRRLLGVGQPYPELRPIRGVGFAWLEDALRARRRIRSAPISSVVRRVPAFWDIAAARSSPVAILNWWATWPAEPVPGHMVSERAFHGFVGLGDEPGLVFPHSLEAELRGLAQRPEQVSYEDARRFADVTPEEWRDRERVLSVNRGALRQELAYYLSLFETTRRLSLRLMQEGRRAFGAPADQLVLFRLVDMTCHAALLESALLAQVFPGAPAHPAAPQSSPRAVSEAYRAMDRAIGELIQEFGDGHVVVVSDHGFDVEWKQGRVLAHHNRAPAGMFLAAGPAIRPGRVLGLTVFDVMPILLYLKGWPTAEDFAGALPQGLFLPERLEASPPQRIASYGSREAPSLEDAGSGALDAEVEERLRALGYVE